MPERSPAQGTDPAERLEKDLGGIILSTIRYEKVTLAFFKVWEYTVTLSVEPGIYVLPICKRIHEALGVNG